MEPQSLEARSIVPSVSLCINLSAPNKPGSNRENARGLASQLRSLGLSATWIVDQPQDAHCLGGGQLASTTQELALTADARSPQRLRSELTNRQAAIQATSGQTVTVVWGDPEQLRARTALLDDLGITTVLASLSPATSEKPLRPLPSGLWQMTPTLSIPQPRRRWALLPFRGRGSKHLVAKATSGQPLVISIEVGLLSARDLKNCVVLFEEIATANRQRLLSVVTASELVAQFATRHEVKPQRSILRRAA